MIGSQKPLKKEMIGCVLGSTNEVLSCEDVRLAAKSLINDIEQNSYQELINVHNVIKYINKNFGVIMKSSHGDDRMIAPIEYNLNKVEDVATESDKSVATLYACGHESKAIILDSNLLSTAAYLQWAEDEGHLEKRDICFSCWCKSDEKVDCKHQFQLIKYNTMVQCIYCGFNPDDRRNDKCKSK